MHWFYDPDFSESSTEIAESERKHLKALRIRSNEEVVITDGNGKSYVCEFSDVDLGQLRVLQSRSHAPGSPKIHLVQALAKGDRDEQALQASVELGVSSVTPWQAELSIAIWGEKRDRNRDRWQEISISAMKQSQQAHLAKVGSLASTNELVPIGFGLLLDPSATVSLSSVWNEPEELTVLVGPEGGITKAEKEVLESKGFVSVRLGDSILRTSTAGPAAIASILTLAGQW